MTVTRSTTEQLLHCYNDIDYLRRKVPINVTDSFKWIKFLIGIHLSILSFLVPHYSKNGLNAVLWIRLKAYSFLLYFQKKKSVELKFFVMSHRAKTLACLHLPWFRECSPALVFVCGAIRELLKEHTDAARLTCGRGLEEEVRDHAKVRGLLAHGGEGHGTSEPSERGTDCRVGRKRKEKNRKT